MSYHTWHEYGYGIITDGIETDIDKVKNLIAMAPKFAKRFYDWLGEDELTMDILEDYEDDACIRGLTAVLRSVINELEPIEFYACIDFDDNNYLMYIQTYPWYMSEAEKNLTEEDIENILKKYVSILTDKEIKVDYQECENGG